MFLIPPTNQNAVTRKGTPIWIFTLIVLIFNACGGQRPNNPKGTFGPQIQAQYYPLNNLRVLDSLPDDSQSLKLISPFKDSLNHQLSEPISFIDSPFYNTYSTGNLGRLAADYMLLAANDFAIKEFGIACHFAISNNGGFRTGLYPGTVTMRHIFEVMPFDNELVLVQLPGRYVDSLFRYIAQLQGTPASGFFLEYSKGQTRFQNQYTSVKINEQQIQNIQDVLNMQCTQPFNSRRDYLIAVNSYMAVGGDGFTMLKHATKTIYTGINLRNILAQQLKTEYNSNRTISPRNTLRIFHEPR